jgi:hypothetical protein
MDFAFVTISDNPDRQSLKVVMKVDVLKKIYFRERGEVATPENSESFKNWCIRYLTDNIQLNGSGEQILLKSEFFQIKGNEFRSRFQILNLPKDPSINGILSIGKEIDYYKNYVYIDLNGQSKGKMLDASEGSLFFWEKGKFSDPTSTGTVGLAAVWVSVIMILGFVYVLFEKNLTSYLSNGIS